jgi:cytochrome c oxidase cbb3-type subunit 2
MKKVGVILFLTVTLSWSAVCLPSLLVFNRLQPLPESPNPEPLSGMALTGMRVYNSYRCGACHTQQVRQISITSADVGRLWGKRSSLLRDTLSQPVFPSGALRIGPDLSNYALRQRDANAVHQLLYASSGKGMPRYPLLYKVQKIQGFRSKRALDLPKQLSPSPGYEILPTYEAECLVAYLLSLKLIDPPFATPIPHVP